MYSDELGFVTLDDRNKDVSALKSTYIPYKALESTLAYIGNIKITDDNHIVNKKYVTTLLKNKVDIATIKPLDSSETDLGIIVSKINELIGVINDKN